MQKRLRRSPKEKCFKKMESMLERTALLEPYVSAKASQRKVAQRDPATRNPGGDAAVSWRHRVFTAFKQVLVRLTRLLDQVVHTSLEQNSLQGLRAHLHARMNVSLIFALYPFDERTNALAQRSCSSSHCRHVVGIRCELRQRVNQ